MTDSNSAAQSATNPYGSTKTAYYALGILTIVYSINFIDRQLLSILQEAIKADIMLVIRSWGCSRALHSHCFTFAGLPIASLADRGNRRNIVAISLTIWSGMTAISGLAQNYWQLLLASVWASVRRIGALLDDFRHFPPEKRASAIISSTGISIGMLFGFLFGGWLNEFFDTSVLPSLWWVSPV